MTFKLNQSSASTSVVPSEAKQLIFFLSSINIINGFTQSSCVQNLRDGRVGP